MTLVLHAGAKPIDYDDLRALSTPPATQTHVPIPHHRVMDPAPYSLSYYGHEVVERHFGVTEDGMRFFGVLTLRSPYGDYCDTLGLRNSHDKSLPIGVAFGSKVFVCDNLSFNADIVIKRKHSVNVTGIDRRATFAIISRSMPACLQAASQTAAAHRNASHPT